MKTQLNVIKSDGSIEEYMHTKVIHTINRALAACGESETDVAECLAEVITYYLYGEQTGPMIHSSEVLSAIKVSLAETGYERAAAMLCEHHFQRKLQRNRIEVFNINGEEISDAEQFLKLREKAGRSIWCKSVIIDDLVSHSGLDRQSARAIAAMVEEKVMGMQVSRVSSRLVKQLVLSDTAAVMYAQKQLQLA